MTTHETFVVSVPRIERGLGIDFLRVGVRSVVLE
jgi:hypothetical protein